MSSYVSPSEDARQRCFCPGCQAVEKRARHDGPFKSLLFYRIQRIQDFFQRGGFGGVGLQVIIGVYVFFSAGHFFVLENFILSKVTYPENLSSLLFGFF